MTTAKQIKMIVPPAQPKTTATIETIDPGLAELLLTSKRYPGQRPVRQWHADRLAVTMRNGTFVQDTPIRIAYCEGNGYLLDGQHRLNAVIIAGIPQRFTIIEIQADSMEQIAWQYGHTDIGMKRTAGDLYTALDTGGKLGLTKQEVMNLSAAVQFMASGCLHHGRTDKVADEVALDYMERYAPFMQEYSQLATNCERSIRNAVVRAATLSVALLSLRFTAPYAKRREAPDVIAFWRGAIFDDGVPLGDPRKLANRHLRNATMGGGGTAAGGGKSFVTAAYSSRYLVSCLNAHIQGRKLAMAKVYDETRPIDLLGVPTDPKLWW
jgi:hypothetical protein